MECLPLWPTDICEKGRTLSKTYGIKARRDWEHPWGTHWELCFVYAKLLDICFVHVMFLFLFILISNFEFEIKHALFFFWFTKFYKLGCICVHYNPNLKTYAQQKKNHFHLSATKISFFLLT
jgi:hypothetical protein